MTKSQVLKLLANSQLDPHKRIELEQYLHYLTAENITQPPRKNKPKYRKKRK